MKPAPYMVNVTSEQFKIRFHVGSEAQAIRLSQALEEACITTIEVEQAGAKAAARAMRQANQIINRAKETK